MDKAIRRTSLSCVVHSRIHATFRQGGRLLRRLIGQVGRVRPNDAALRLHSRCCGVHRIIRPGGFVISLTFSTVGRTNIAPLIGPVHKNASNTHLSFVKLPYPGVFTNKLGFRKQCRFLPIGSLRGDVRAVIGVTRLLIGNGCASWVAGRGS